MGLTELLDVAYRWAHMIAGIMWVGNSMLFNWLDRNLEKSGPLAPLSQGKIFMVHSGAFYDVEKKLLAPGELPPVLHWFKWQNGITWLTGISLFVVVYYFADGSAGGLVDPNVMQLDRSVSITISLASLLTGWLIYDGLWRAYGEQNPRVATALSIAMLFAAVYGFTQIFSGRAAYMQVGVMIGTLMTGNVWLCILPSQHGLIRATERGEDQDPVLSLRAKQRSIHNNYFTFPLLFIMVSNHFGAAYAHHLNWLILILVMVGGAGVRHMMNTRYLGEGRVKPVVAWLAPAGVMAAIAVTGLFVVTKLPRPAGIVITEPVTFARAQEILVTRCTTCHSIKPSDEFYRAPPNNIVFDTPEHIRLLAPRIRERAVSQRTMPLQNKTGITERERAELGKWIDDGASIE